MKKTFLSLICIIQLSWANAQEWERFYEGTAALEVSEADNGQLRLLNCDNSRKFLFVQKSTGQLDSIANAGFCQPASTYTDGSYEAEAVTSTDSLLNVRIKRLDNFGEIIWQRTYGSLLSDMPLAVLQTRDSGVVVAYRRNISVFNNQSNLNLVKLDKNGIYKWQRTYSMQYDTNPIWSLINIMESPIDRSLVFYYSFTLTYIYKATQFYYLNENGATRFSKTFGIPPETPGFYNITSIVPTTWQGLNLTYSRYYPPGPGIGGPQIFDVKYNNIGQPTTHPKYAPIGQELSDGGTIICENIPTGLLVKKIAANGDIIRQKEFQGTAYSLLRLEDGTIYIAGKKYGQTWLMKLDSLLSQPIFTGRIFWDKNQNCIFDTGEEGLEGLPISIQNSLSNITVKSGPSGFYKAGVSADSATVFQFLLPSGNWDACIDSMFFLSINSQDSFWLDIPVHIFDTCSPVSGTIGAKFLYPQNGLGANIYDLEIINHGILPVHDAKLTLQLDPQMLPGTGWPLQSVTPHEWAWNIGTLAPLQRYRVEAPLQNLGYHPGQLYCSSIDLEISENGCPNSMLIDNDCQFQNSSLSNGAALSAYPVGISSQHFINPDEEIQYKINFQRFGFNGSVEIYDTLSPYIDTSVFSPGASTYPFSAQMLNDSVVYIYIPQAYAFFQTGNYIQPNADGYVKFTLRPKPDTPAGTVLTSRAGVHYSNDPAPEITNGIFHTITNTQFTKDTLLACKGSLFNQSILMSDTMIIDTFHLLDYDSIVFRYILVNPAYHIIQDLEICEGDAVTIGPHIYFLSGIYVDTLNSGFVCDSIVTTNLTVHPDMFIFVDTILPYGTLYQGINLTHDTVFVFYDTTQFGCLLTVSESVAVGPSAVNNLAKMVGLEVFPNLTSSYFYIEFTLPEAMNLDIHIIDLLGREMAVDSDDELFQEGKQQIRVDASDWPSGIYYLQIQSYSKTIIKKLIKTI